MGQDELVAEALRAFRRMAEPLGLKLGTYSASLLSARTAPPRVVLRLDDGERALILTWVEPPAEAEALITSARAQEAARKAMASARPGDAAFRVPRVLAISEAARAILTEEAQGRPLEARLVDAQDAAPLLGRAGGWLAAFHGATAVERRPFRAAFTLRYVARLAAETARRPASLPEGEAFQRFADRLPDLAAAADGVESPVAQSHGDMSLRRLYLSGTETQAVRFRPASKASVAFDVARLLTDVLQITQVPLPAGAAFALPPAVLDGFFPAYGLIGPDDPVLLFLLRVRMLAEWRAIPGNPAVRSWRQDRRWSAIRAMAPALFDLPAK